MLGARSEDDRLETKTETLGWSEPHNSLAKDIT
jgi:hypothetical protein